MPFVRRPLYACYSPFSQVFLAIASTINVVDIRRATLHMPQRHSQYFKRTVTLRLGRCVLVALLVSLLFILATLVQPPTKGRSKHVNSFESVFEHAAHVKRGDDTSTSTMAKLGQRYKAAKNLEEKNQERRKEVYRELKQERDKSWSENKYFRAAMHTDKMAANKFDQVVHRIPGVKQSRAIAAMPRVKTGPEREPLLSKRAPSYSTIVQQQKFTSSMFRRSVPDVTALARSKSVGAAASHALSSLSKATAFKPAASNAAKAAKAGSAIASRGRTTVRGGGGRAVSPSPSFSRSPSRSRSRTDRQGGHRHFSSGAKMGVASSLAAAAGVVLSNVQVSPPPITVVVKGKEGKGRGMQMNTHLGSANMNGNVRLGKSASFNFDKSSNPRSFGTASNEDQAAY